MIKNILALIFGSVITHQSFAQINVGIKGGLNIVSNKAVISIPANSDIDSKYRPAYHIGIYSTVPFKEKFFLQPEFLFSNKGSKFDYKNVDYSVNLHLYYLNLPILIGFEPIEGFNLLLGPEIGYLLSARFRFDSKSADASDFWDNKFDFALATGISYSIIEKIDIGLRYSHGFSSVIKDHIVINELAEPTDEKISHQNRTFQLSLGYKIN